MTTPTPVKETAAKFWVSLVGAVLMGLSLVGLPGWWGKGVAIAVAALTAAGVYQTDNKPLPPPYMVSPWRAAGEAMRKAKTDDGT